MQRERRWDEMLIAGMGLAVESTYGQTDAARNQQWQIYSLLQPGEKNPGSYKSTVRNSNPEEQNQTKTKYHIIKNSNGYLHSQPQD